MGPRIQPFFISLLLFHFLSILLAASVRRPISEQLQLKRFDIQIQGYSPVQDDDYVAVAIKAEPGYIVKFEPFAHADRVHHMLLYGCSSPAYPERNFWQGMGTCSGSSHILYAWARNAPPLNLPSEVAFAIGNEGDPVQYIVLQIHYAKQFAGNVLDFSGITLHLSPHRPRFLAGVYLMLSGEPIQPGHTAYFTNMSCTYEADTKLYPFAFRTHTHQMGRVVSAYVRKKSENRWHQIGKRNPQWPQLFQPRENPGHLVIDKGDSMAGTCRYDSSDKTDVVPMGSMGMNEMCNFYMMFYWDAAQPDPFPVGGGCWGDLAPELLKEYPEDGTTLLPSHPDLEHRAHQSGAPFGVIERERITEFGGEKLGQVAGLAVDPEGKLWILHRAGRVWDATTFDGNNQLREHNPIQRPVILVGRQRPQDGKLELVAKYGAGALYLPHGIAVGADGREVFTTDVGSHQVIKWRISSNGKQMKEVWRLGEQFVPGADRKHFCKPAGVAVHSGDGSVWIADGYCNNRVLKFSAHGEFMAEFGHATSMAHGGPQSLRLGELSLPHDIALDEAGERVMVADRENGRVQAFAMGGGERALGEPLWEVRRPDLFSTVYSAHYQPGIGLIFVPGTSVYGSDGQPHPIEVFVVPNTTQHPHVQYAFRPQSSMFRLPHVLRSWGAQVYVGEIANGEGVLWSLEIQSESAKASAKASVYHGAKPLTHLLPDLPLGLGGLGRRTHVVGSELLNESSALVLLLLLVCVCCALGLMAWQCCWCCGKGGEQDMLDRKGFKLLRTFELDDEEMFSAEEDEEDYDFGGRPRTPKEKPEKRNCCDGRESTTTPTPVDGREKESGL